MWAGIVDDSEMDQREALGPPALDLVERGEPGQEVELGWGRRRPDEAVWPDANTGRIARVEGSVGRVITDVMVGVSGAREDVEVQGPVSQQPDVPLRDRSELAPQLVERVAVQPAGAPLETRRVDEVGRAHLRDVDLEAGVFANEHAGRSRVIEMDMTEEEVVDVLEGDAAPGEPLLELVNTR